MLLKAGGETGKCKDKYDTKFSRGKCWRKMPKHCKTQVLLAILNDISKPFVLNQEDPQP